MMRFILLLLLLSLSSISAADYSPLQHTEIGIFSSLPNQPTLIQPIFSPDNGMHTLVRLITSATSTIDVQNQYFYKFNRNNDWLLSSSATDTRSPNPRPIDIHPLIAALYLASKRGVRVRVSLPACHAGYATSASGCRSPDTYNAVAFFQSVGIQVRLLNNTDLYIHNKGWVIDQQIVVISSINFSKTSLTDNREAGVVITDTRLAAWYGAEFQYDWEQSVEVTPTSPPASVRDPNITLIMSYYPEIPHPPVRVYATFYTFTTNGANQIMSFNLLKQQTAATKKVFHAQMYEMTSNTVIQPILDMIDAGYPNGLDASIIVTSSTVEGSDDLTRVNLLVNNQLPNGTPAPAHVWYSSNNFTYQHAKFWLMDGINTTIYSGNWAGTSFPTNNNNGRNREWGISITSICINSIFESIWQQDRKRASAFVPPQANAGLTTPNDCTIDSCGICSRSGITSTCYDIATVCVDGASATGPFDGTPSTNPGTPGTTGTNTGSNTGTTTGSSTGTKSNAATSPSATSLLVFLLPFMILFA